MLQIEPIATYEYSPKGGRPVPQPASALTFLLFAKGILFHLHLSPFYFFPKFTLKPPEEDKMAVLSRNEKLRYLSYEPSDKTLMRKRNVWHFSAKKYELLKL